METLDTTTKTNYWLQFIERLLTKRHLKNKHESLKRIKKSIIAHGEVSDSQIAALKDIQYPGVR